MLHLFDIPLVNYSRKCLVFPMITQTNKQTNRLKELISCSHDAPVQLQNWIECLAQVEFAGVSSTRQCVPFDQTSQQKQVSFFKKKCLNLPHAKCRFHFVKERLSRLFGRRVFFLLFLSHFSTNIINFVLTGTWQLGQWGFIRHNLCV